MELADKFPGKVVADWTGNTESISQTHYQKATEEQLPASRSKRCRGDIETRTAKSLVHYLKIWRIIRRAKGRK